MDEDGFEKLRREAEESLGLLAGLCQDGHVVAAKTLVEDLRNARLYELMGRLAEAVSRRDPDDAKNRRLYAQYLIEAGMATVALDLLRPLMFRLPSGHAEHAEAAGLIGRANKQVFFDAGDKAAPAARRALAEAIEAYRGAFDRDPVLNTWHGVNLAALLQSMRRLGIVADPNLDFMEVAGRVAAALEAVPEGKRDEWYLPTLAEVKLAQGEWDEAERHIRAYAAVPDAKGFLVASTLRQLTEVWGLEATSRGKTLIEILRARLLQLGGAVTLVPAEVRQLQRADSASEAQFEAVLGKEGAKTFHWWRKGLDRARSVASIRQVLGTRWGTGFLVCAEDLGLGQKGEQLVVTNHHVVNQEGAGGALAPSAAEVVFEAADSDRTYGVESIVWFSPRDRHDVTVLRLNERVVGVEPLPLAAGLPILEETAKVYVIGYPGGRDLSFSFQDNALLDHEGPPEGTPPIPDVCRVHYRAPTEGGSSGSPVFNSTLWEVVAVHHLGGKLGMPLLNGKAGTYAANEGISISSVRKAILGGES